MESAALVMLFSGMSVMFGWQPMPDAASNGGAPKVEYIVQIEPELAATLQAGHSIPITSDIPDDIGPIGRIRIVVGRDELPRQKLATHFKPWPTQQTREGIVETQHTVPPVQSGGPGRYSNPTTATNNPILPLSGGAAATANPLGQTLQQGAQQAKNLAADVKQQIFPPAEQLFTQGRTNNQGLQNAINNTMNQLQQGLQQGVQQGADNLGQGARNAADKIGRSLLPQQPTPNDGRGHNDHGHSGHAHAAQGSPQASGTILPLSTQPAGLAGKGRRIDQPVQPRRQQPQTQTVSQPAPQQRANTNWPTHQPATPEIRKGMMDQPSGVGMQTADNSPGYQQQTVARQSIDNSPIETQLRGYGRNQNTNNDYPNNTSSTDPKRDTLFPLLLSWVLLSGSGAGNAYLWWSYLDVRSKYRGVVHGSPRRRDRYDD